MLHLIDIWIDGFKKNILDWLFFKFWIEMSVNSFKLHFKIIFFYVKPIVFKDYWKEKTEKHCKNLNVVTGFYKNDFYLLKYKYLFYFNKQLFCCSHIFSW